MFGPSAFYLCGRRGEDFVCIDVRSDISLSVQQLIRARPNCLLLVPAESSAVIMDIDLYQDLKKNLRKTERGRPRKLGKNLARSHFIGKITFFLLFSSSFIYIVPPTDICDGNILYHKICNSSLDFWLLLYDGQL